MKYESLSDMFSLSRFLKYSFRHRSAALATAAISGGTTAFVIWHLMFRIRAIDPIYNHLYLSSSYDGVAIRLAIIVAGITTGVLLYRRKTISIPPASPAADVTGGDINGTVSRQLLEGYFWQSADSE